MQTHLRVMTYNIAGGREINTSDRENLVQVILEIHPDLLALQEAWQIVDLDGRCIDVTNSISVAMGGYPSAFCPTLSMREQFHVGKEIFVDGLFEDWQDWKLGNGLISRWDFTRLGDASLPGTPVNIPLYRPATYEGTRDTDPRWVVISRINCGSFNPFILVSHLTTLIGERRGSTPAVQGKTEQAQALRSRQAKSIVDLVRKHILGKRQFAILMGDFNAVATEPCLQDVLQGVAGFTRLVPDIEAPTHPKAPSPIDHILVFPGERQFDYHCWIVDEPSLSQVSDHLPVIADITVETE